MNASSVQVLPVRMNRGVHSSLRVPADLTVVSFIRSAFACMLTREGWTGEGAGRVLLASSEAITNAIEHGSPLGGAIEVEISVAEERTLVRVTDEGRPGMPTPRLPTVAPPPSSERGRGLLIISRLADDLDLAPNGSGTTVTAGFTQERAADPVAPPGPPALAGRPSRRAA